MIALMTLSVFAAGGGAVLLLLPGDDPLLEPGSVANASGGGGPAEVVERSWPGQEPAGAAGAGPRPTARAVDAERLKRAQQLILDPSLPVSRRRGALSALEVLEPELAARLALEILREAPGGTLEAEALRLLGRTAELGGLGTMELVRYVVAVLERTTDPEIALAAGNALDALPADAIDSSVLRSAFFGLSTPEGRVVVLRAISLCEAQPEQRADLHAFLQQILLNDASGQVRAEALSFAARSGGPGGIEMTLSALGRDPELRPHLARALSGVKGSEVDRYLERAFHGERDPLAALAMARVMVSRSEEVPEALERAALGSSGRASAVVEALGVSLNPSREALLRDVLQRGASEAARYQALLSLGRAGKLGAQELKTLASGDGSERIRATATELLEADEDRENEKLMEGAG